MEDLSPSDRRQARARRRRSCPLGRTFGGRPTALWTIGLILAVSALAAPATRAVDAWQHVGPFGATLLSVAADPGGSNLRIAGGFSGAFRSTDAGAMWERADGTLPNRDIASSWIATSGDVFLGTFGDGVFRSTDDGETFAPANASLESASVFSLFETSGALWAGTGGDGIWRSTDDGDSWESRSAGVENLQINQILQLESGDLLAAAGATSSLGGVFRSTDEGLTWSASSMGLTNLRVVTLAAAPEDSVLYAGTVLNGLEESGVYRSTDAGATWALSVNGITNFMISEVLVDPSDPNVVYVATQRSPSFSTSGVFRSTDSGSSWDLVEGNPPVSDFRSLIRLADGSFMAGVAGKSTVLGGIYVSQNGVDWTRSDTGISVLRCRTVVSSPIEADRFWTGAVGTFREPGGVYASPDRGMTWSENTTDGMTEAILSLWIDPVDPVRRFAGTRSGVFFWNDELTEWMAAGLSSVEVRRLSQVSGAVPEIWAATASGLRSTINDGLTWEPRTATIEPVGVQAAVVDPADPQRVFVATDDQGVFESTDGGLSWTARNANLTSLNLRDLVLASGGTTLLAATDAGIFEFDLTAQAPPEPTWVDRSMGLDSVDVRDLVVVRDVRVAATASGVYRSGDEDPVPWVADNPGLFNLDVQAVHADTTGGRLRLFAATQGDAVFVGDEVVPVVLARFDADATPGRVELTFATSFESRHSHFRIERRLESEVPYTVVEERVQGGPDYRWVDADERLRPGTVAEYALVAVDLAGGEERFGPFRVRIGAEAPSAPDLAAAPNPFRTSVRFVTGGDAADLSIYDAAGRVVLTRTLPAGEPAWEWTGEMQSGAVAPSGVYWARLTTATGVASVRIVRVR